MMLDSAKKVTLSKIDKEMLKILLYPNGRSSSKLISMKLGLPESTVQRHRRRLEKEVLHQNYTLDVTKFGWHQVDFLIATDCGKTDLIGKSLLKRDEIIYVGKSIGQHTIDLRVETVLEDNSEILRMMELLKSTEGIREVVW